MSIVFLLFVIATGIQKIQRLQSIDLQGKADLYLSTSNNVSDIDRFFIAVERSQGDESGASGALDKAMQRLAARLAVTAGKIDLEDPNDDVASNIVRAEEQFRAIKAIMAINDCDDACRAPRLMPTVGNLRLTLVQLRAAGGDYLAEAHVLAEQLQSDTLKAIYEMAGLFTLLTILSGVHLRRRNHSLKRQMVRAENSERQVLQISDYRARFLAGMSHELRTPLNAIKGFSQFLLMSDMKLSEDVRRDYLVDIEKSAVDLEGLMGSVLDLAKVDAGTFELHRENFDLVALLEEVARQTDLTESRLLLKAPDALHLHADRLVIKRCIQNLTSNAMKFSSDPVFLEVAETEHDFIIRVIDRGVGLSRHDLEEVWMPYRRVAEVRHSNQQGTGLGLPITKELISLHDGKIGMESELGVGTKVTVRLPKAKHLPIEGVLADTTTNSELHAGHVADDRAAA